MASDKHVHVGSPNGCVLRAPLKKSYHYIATMGRVYSHSLSVPRLRSRSLESQGLRSCRWRTWSAWWWCAMSLRRPDLGIERSMARQRDQHAPPKLWLNMGGGGCRAKWELEPLQMGTWFGTSSSKSKKIQGRVPLNRANEDQAHFPGLQFLGGSLLKGRSVRTNIRSLCGLLRLRCPGTGHEDSFPIPEFQDAFTLLFRQTINPHKKSVSEVRLPCSSIATALSAADQNKDHTTTKGKLRLMAKTHRG